VPMPGFTHTRAAEPITVGHFAAAHAAGFARDHWRLGDVRRRVNILPLGSGALAGTSLPLDRDALARDLGFDGVSWNALDAVTDRDFAAEFVAACAILQTHLARLAEDLILFGTGEFGFARYGEAYTTGSSMMPQKRNPDALELARGSGARAIGDLATLLATLKGLPSGYNKDLQDDKRVLFDAVDTILLVLPAVAGALHEIRFNAKRMHAALSSSMMATDLADYLVEKGASFRDAHAAIGSLIRESERDGCELDALPIASFKTAHPLFGDDVLDWLEPSRSVARRDVPGGTGPSAVSAQLRTAREALWPVTEAARGNELVLSAV